MKICEQRLVLVIAIVLVVGRGFASEGPPSEWVEEIGSPQYFAVLVEDVDASVAWYRAVFGLEELGGSKADDGSWRIENLGNEQLLVEIVRDSRSQAADRALGFRKVGFWVKDVNEVADRVERATGERPRVVPFEPLRQRIVQLKDPEGNTIQLISRLE